ncbi:MAG: response regulator [Lachnospiraceae bacterium]|nr:response regulator [Lachnospiraceae bacterium]
MQSSFKKWFGAETPLEEINFNIGMVFLFVSYAASFLSGIYMHLDYRFYFLIGIGMILMTFFIGYASQSGKYQIASFAIVTIFEVVVFPGTYIIDGRFMSFMIFYYIIVFLLIVYVQEGRLRIISYLLFCITLILSVVYTYYQLSLRGMILSSGVNIYLDILLPLIICSLFAICGTYASIRYYKTESAKAEESRKSADDVEKSKDIFLMNMSHEIRTPMNAIMSAGEIMLSKNISGDTQNNVHHITNACRALISTLDDLMIFSKSGGEIIEMQESEYDLMNLLDDIINMISVRLMDSEVRLYVYIDPYIPKRLYGDVVRIRQVFINILNNAVKYTKQGHIILRVVMSDVMTDRMVLHADVTDTGIGIKEEMLPTLFKDFSRVADNINESLKAEGSGLGLSITKNIINACGGDIKVTSEYNKGSVFSFDLPQRIADSSPIAVVENCNDLGVIICDDDTDMKEVLTDTLRAMRIKCTTVTNSEEMNSAIREGIYSHLFITAECLEGSCDLPILMGANITIVLMRNVDDPEEALGDGTIVKPLSCLNIARYFDNQTDKAKALTAESEPEEVSQDSVHVSGARALVVEDNITNLLVSEKLLTRMGFEVSTASNGTTALSLAKVMSFDILFIDFMMTGMNGIDTLREVRKLNADWAKRVPCIVLTADTHEGAKQMLINAGFDDYLAKPIDMEEMEYMVTRYLPGEKLI